MFDARKDDAEEGNAVGLIFLDGGPLHGSAYDTKDLLGAPEAALPRGYVWTSERKTSPRTGKTAQVWRYAGDVLNDLAPDPDPNLTPGVTAPPVPDHTPPPPVDLPPAPDGDVAGRSPDVDPPEEMKAELAAAGPAIRDRRKAVKVSAGDLGTRAGIKQSRVYAIETGSGKPPSEDEHARLEAALAELEAEASAH